MLLIDGVLANAHKISPTEYGILAQAEAAALLWNFDKERSLPILKSAVEAMQKLLDEQSKEEREDWNSRRGLLRSSILRKIARLSPDLLKKLLVKDSAEDHRQEPLSIWPTPEARAVLQAAEERIADDPQLAIRVAQQSLYFGIGDWRTFLSMLKRGDSRMAEQTATWLITQLRDSRISPVNFQEADGIVFARDASPQLREHYFRSLAIRLRRDIRPDLPEEELESSLGVAQDALESAARRFPQMKAEFEEIKALFQAIYQERFKSSYTSPPPIMIDTSMMEGAKPGDTKEIEENASKAEKVRDARSRDEEYQKLATSAALRADLRVAEDMMSKIESEEIRQETTMSVYAPLARKAISESDWTQAQSLALKIADPIGRTFVLDRIALSQPQTVEGQQKAKEIYDTADAQLRRSIATENVAKAYLILAKSILRTDPDSGIEAMRSAVYALNKTTAGGELSEGQKISDALAPWITLPSWSYSHAEALDLTELIGPLFKETAKRNADEAQAMAYGLKHQGLYSLAQLGIARQLLEEAAATTDRKSLRNPASK